MIGLLLVSHGNMAAGVVDSMTLIGGKPKNTDVSSLLAGQDMEVFKQETLTKIIQLDQGDGVLIFVDLYGASPFTSSLTAYQILKEKGHNISVVTGFNLSMLLEVSAMRTSGISLAELTKIAISSGKDGIQYPIEQLSHASDYIEDDY